MIYQNIDIADFQQLGNFSKNIDQALIQRGLLNCEISILQRWMGLQAVSQYDDYSDEAKSLVHRALELLATAWVMKNNIYVSRGGAIEKKDSDISRNLTTAELNTQVSCLRAEARLLLQQAEHLVVSGGCVPFEWRREINVLNLWHLNFISDDNVDSTIAIEVVGVFDDTFDDTFYWAPQPTFDETFDKTF